VKNLLIAYDTRAGKVKRFVQKLGMSAVAISEDLSLEEPYILVTYTDGRGQVPMTTEAFLKRCGKHMFAVAASGNKVFEHFARSADLIAHAYDVPIILKFEMAGLTKDVNYFREWVEKYATHFAQQ
jgi:protein involved in ribonucleotide reduction